MAAQHRASPKTWLARRPRRSLCAIATSCAPSALPLPWSPRAGPVGRLSPRRLRLCAGRPGCEALAARGSAPRAERPCARLLDMRMRWQRRPAAQRACVRAAGRPHGWQPPSVLRRRIAAVQVRCHAAWVDVEYDGRPGCDTVYASFDHRAEIVGRHRLLVLSVYEREPQLPAPAWVLPLSLGCARMVCALGGRGAAPARHASALGPTLRRDRVRGLSGARARCAPRGCSRRMPEQRPRRVL